MTNTNHDTVIASTETTTATPKLRDYQVQAINELLIQDQTTASHTPGPWEANGTTVVASKESFRALFDCKPLRMTLSADECAANAHLIAAAPDLLEALEALSGLRVKGHALIDRLQFSEEGRALSAKINAAIAKAKAMAA